MSIPIIEMTDDEFEQFYDWLRDSTYAEVEFNDQKVSKFDTLFVCWKNSNGQYIGAYVVVDSVQGNTAFVSPQWIHRANSEDGKYVQN